MQPLLLPPSSADFRFEGPLTNPQEAVVLGNGDLGALVTASSHKVHIVLGKNDCWDARFDFDTEKYIFRHEDLVRIVEEYGWSRPVTGGSVPEPSSEKPLPDHIIIPPHYSRYHKQSRYSSPSPKRVAEVIVDHPGISSTKVNGRLSLKDGCLNVRYDYSAGRSLTVHAFIHAVKNVLCVRVITEGRIPWCRLTIRKNPDAVDETIPPPSIELLEGDVVRFGQRIPEAEGFEAFEWFAASRLAGIPFAYEISRLMGPKDGEAVDLSVAVATSRESGDPAAQCVEMLDKTNEGSWEKNKLQHEQWWQSFWAKSGVRMEDQELESAWYRDLYGLACNMREGANCPGLNGNMIPWDGIMWHSDYHFNLNMQKTFIPVIPANHVELAMAYADLIDYCLPTWRWIAEHVYGVKGAMIELSAFPYQPYDKPYIHPLWRELGTLSWTLQPIWWLWEYTRNRDLLRDRVYPAIKDAAVFCYTYLHKYQKVPGGDLYPSAASESYGWTKNFEYNRNIPSDIAAFRQCMKRAIAAADALGVDDDWICRWEEGIDRLPDDEPLWAKRKLSHYSGMYRVYPAEDLDTTAEEDRVTELREQAAALPLKSDFHCAPFYLPGSVRLKDANAFERVRQTLVANRLPNGMPWLGMVAETGFTPADWGHLTENFWMNFVVTELLLQSHHGIIQLFPVWPHDREASFENLRAVGGFLVSASVSGGEIHNVRIFSEAGEPCTLLWPGGSPRIIEEATGGVIGVDGREDRWTFHTKPRHAYTISGQ